MSRTKARMHSGRPVVGFLLTTAACIALIAASTALAARALSRKEGLRAFETIQQVLQHPRCQNCHIPGDAPLQFDDGVPHAQNVLRGHDGQGMPGMNCSSCHGTANLPASYGPRTPPGAPNWHLPPADQKMVFIDLSPGELCGVLKNPATNGGRDLDALLEHVEHDKLVLWGWEPGEGRATVSVPHKQFVAEFKRWMAARAPCPSYLKL